MLSVGEVVDAQKKHFPLLPFVSEMFQSTFHPACSNEFGSDSNNSQIILSFKTTEINTSRMKDTIPLCS